jgi:hypothetical protein
VRAYSSAALVSLRSLGLELEGDEALVSNDGRVMTRFDHISVTSSKLGLRAMVMDDTQRARLNESHVPHLAAVGACHWLYALRPLPPRFKNHTGGRSAP